MQFAQLASRSQELAIDLENEYGKEVRDRYVAIESLPKQGPERFLFQIETVRGMKPVMLTKGALCARMYRDRLEAGQTSRRKKEVAKLKSIPPPPLTDSSYQLVLELIGDDEAWITAEQLSDRLCAQGEKTAPQWVYRRLVGLTQISLMVRKDDRFRMATEHDRAFDIGSMVISRAFKKSRRIGIVTKKTVHPYNPIEILTIEWCGGLGESKSLLGSDIALLVKPNAEKALFLFGHNVNPILKTAALIRSRIAKRSRCVGTPRDRLLEALTYRESLTLGQVADLLGENNADQAIRQLKLENKIGMRGFPRAIFLVSK